MPYQIKNIFASIVCRGDDWEILHTSENFGLILGLETGLEHAPSTPQSLLTLLYPTTAGLEGPQGAVEDTPQGAIEGTPSVFQEANGEAQGVLASGKHFYMRWSCKGPSIGSCKGPCMGTGEGESAGNVRLVDVVILTDEQGETLFPSFPHLASNWHRQQLLFDSLHDGIWIIDGQGITMAVNKSMERIADIRREDVVGKHVAVARKDLGFSHCVTLHALEEKRAVTMFDDYANGTRCLNTSTPIFNDDGTVWRVIASIRDITELKTMQERLAELELANQHYKDKLSHFDACHLGLVGTSEPTVALRDHITKAARTNAVVLVLGETGTGKTLAAQSIHNGSARKDGPFVALNCGGIPPTLIESELFGYERGAFTGASTKGKKGVFEQAQGGTLFLDEIAELPLATQATLLHFLDDFTFRRVGGTHTVQTDVRIIAATNKSLETLVARGQFRADLFYRLRVVVVTIPALRHRPEDVPALMRHFLKTLEGDRQRTFSASMLHALASYAWPGNFRELRGLVQYLHTMCDREMFDMEDLPSHMLQDLPSGIPQFIQSHSLKDAVEELEKRMLVSALQELKSTYKVAKRLKISQSTVVRKAQKYKLCLVDSGDSDDGDTGDNGDTGDTIALAHQ